MEFFEDALGALTCSGRCLCLCLYHGLCTLDHPQLSFKLVQTFQKPLTIALEEY
jgi:hypothetical protein